MKKLIKISLLAVLAVMMVLSACNGSNTKTQSGKDYTFTDSLGNTVTVNNPQRVVTVMGSFAQIWCLAGGGDVLVGSTDDTIDTRDLGVDHEITKIGSYTAPNIEKIIGCDPDLVILTGGSSLTTDQKTLEDTFKENQINYCYFTVTHFEDYLHMLDICTDITGKKDNFKKYGTDVKANIEKIIKDNKVDGAPSYLLMITYSGGIRPQASTTQTGKMISDLGAHNIIDDMPSLLKEFSMEKVIELDPDYIFAISMGYTEASAEEAIKKLVESDPAWNQLSAVKAGKYYLLPREMFQFKPNEKWDQAYQYLADILNA